LRQVIVEGSARRIRPKFMTAATMIVGLAPVMWSTGTGADVMKRIAAPMIGGIVTSFLLELVVYPALYEIWKWDLGRKRSVVEVRPVVAGVAEPGMASAGD
jgi:Cu(I)/Ag(I) efflux system membrane protein CusA/SilA